MHSQMPLLSTGCMTSALRYYVSAACMQVMHARRLLLILATLVVVERASGGCTAFCPVGANCNRSLLRSFLVAIDLLSDCSNCATCYTDSSYAYCCTGCSMSSSTYNCNSSPATYTVDG